MDEIEETFKSKGIHPWNKNGSLRYYVDDWREEFGMRVSIYEMENNCTIKVYFDHNGEPVIEHCLDLHLKEEIKEFMENWFMDAYEEYYWNNNSSYFHELNGWKGYLWDFVQKNGILEYKGETIQIDNSLYSHLEWTMKVFVDVRNEQIIVRYGDDKIDWKLRAALIRLFKNAISEGMLSSRVI